MRVALLQFELLIDHSHSLKDKRRVVKSLKDRLHREHLVSIAEIGSHELLNRAELGVAAVSHDPVYLSALLDRIITKLNQLTEARLGRLERAVVDAGNALSELDDDPSTTPPTNANSEDDEDLWRPEERRLE